MYVLDFPAIMLGVFCFCLVRLCFFFFQEGVLFFSGRGFALFVNFPFFCPGVSYFCDEVVMLYHVPGSLY